MSKFIKAVSAYQKSRTYQLQPLKNIEFFSNTVDLKIEDCYEYEIGVVAKNKILCPPHELTDAVYFAKKQLIETLFGEFREGILDIRGALYRNDIKGAISKLNELDFLMFEDGL